MDVDTFMMTHPRPLHMGRIVKLAPKIKVSKPFTICHMFNRLCILVFQLGLLWALILTKLIVNKQKYRVHIMIFIKSPYIVFIFIQYRRSIFFLFSSFHVPYCGWQIFWSILYFSSTYPDFFVRTLQNKVWAYQSLHPV